MADITEFAGLELPGTYLDEDLSKLRSDLVKIDAQLKQAKDERTAEAKARQEADDALGEGLSAEAVARQRGGQYLADALSIEAGDREEAEKALQKRIDAFEVARGKPLGLATLDADGIVPATQIPFAADSDTTSKDRVATPACIVSWFGKSLTESGWQILPSGLILQWGWQSNIIPNPTRVVFPVSFPNSILQVIGSPYRKTVPTLGLISIADFNVSGFTFNSFVAPNGVSPGEAGANDAVIIKYIAIGF